MSSDSEKFSERLKFARETLRKLSQTDLAEKAGLQPSAISHFETGRRSPSFDNLRRLADALNVTTDYLLGRADDPTGHAGTPSGPTVGKLYRDAENMSQDDLQILADFAEMLTRKAREKKSTP